MPDDPIVRIGREPEQDTPDTAEEGHRPPDERPIEQMEGHPVDEHRRQSGRLEAQPEPAPLAAAGDEEVEPRLQGKPERQGAGEEPGDQNDRAIDGDERHRDHQPGNRRNDV